MRDVMKELLIRTGALAGVLSLVLASGVSAQPAGGTISGKVTLGEGGEPVHGAAVILVNARRTTTTNDDGSFELLDVPPGTYEVLVQREHFGAARQTVTVTAGQTATLTVAISLSGVHENVVVTATAGGAATVFESFSSVTSLDGVELAKNRGATIADALANQPGIATRSFGAGNTRPIIRGFDGDRVLVMQDGVRTGDLSSQSGDHGVSIDPAALERLEVVKGPATLLYGGNAIGGVVNAISPQDAFRASPFTGLLGGITTDTGSANGQAGAAGNFQYGRGPWNVWAGGGARRTGDYDTPAGTIDNSATDLRNARFGVGWVGNRAFFSVGGTVERSRFGIPFAGEFHHHAEEEPAAEEEDHLDVDIESNRQDVRFDLGLRNLTGRFLDTAKLTVGATNYRHDELEIAGGAETLGTRFDNDTKNLRAELEQKRMGRLTGRLGMEWFGRDYLATGEEALAPATTQSSFAAFAYEEVAFPVVRLQFGGRIERTAYEATPRAEPDHAHEGEPGAQEDEPPDVRDRTFTGASASFGVHRDLGRHAALVADVRVASRAPALEELYNFGPHVGNLAFEIGNPDLELERTVGLDISLRSKAPRASGQFNVFTYRISNFVFLDFTGEEVDGLREARFLQGDSRYFGVEASGSVDVGRAVRLNAGFSAVSAKLTDADEHLPRIPPLSGRLELDLPWRGLTVSPEIVLTARQENVFRDETTTEGFGLLNIGATYFVVRRHATHSITLKAHNLTNKEYRLHTSFLKDLAPEMGRGVKVTYGVKFF
jgi:iron complex outermembrane receptor protein